MSRLLLLFLSLGFFIYFTDSANVLAIYFHGGKSHHILGEELCKELARRGHNITMASAFPLAKPFPNYTDIHLTGIREHQLSQENLFQKLKDHENSVKVRRENQNLFYTQAELTLNHTEMQKLIKSGTKFDVIIMDYMFNDANFIFGRLFNAPIIAVSSAGSSLANHLVGNVRPISYGTILPFPEPMSFLHRLYNFLFVVIAKVVGIFHFKEQTELVRKYYKDAPSVEELHNDIALVLALSHYSFEPPKPYVPNMIPVGGFHVQKPKKLPNDLQKFMDDAKEGVVYFSLGSNFKSSIISDEKQKQILKAFSKIPQKVLWKFDGELKNLPKNVMIKNWIPQTDVLGHPNTKLFISHGGLLSSTETLHFGVPIIGIPIASDQKTVVPRIVNAGYGLLLELDDLDEESLSRALNEILNNPIYTENAKKRSALLRDQPLSPMDTAVFWVEHVIRHKGAPHLKNTGFYQPLYQYLMLDVILFILTVFFVIYKVLKFVICKVLCCGQSQKIKKE